MFDAETPVAIGAVKATVKLPGSVAAGGHCRGGPGGLRRTVDRVLTRASTMVYEATDIPSFTSFWTVTGFPKGVVKYRVDCAARCFNYITPKVGFALPILVFLTMFLIWFRRGRDQPGATYAKYVSEPPSDLSPGLVGALIDERVDTKEVIATIVDLARRGYIEITDTQEEGHPQEATYHVHSEEVLRRSGRVREEDSGVALRLGSER